MLENAAQARAHCDPHVPQRFGAPRVFDLLGADAAHVRERAVDGANHVGDRDLCRRPGEPVAALCAALAADEAVVPKVAEDVLEELERDLLRLRDPLAFDRPVVACCRELYDNPANEFVMGFVGQANRFGDSWVRPHDLEVTLAPNGTTREAMVDRVTHLGFEVRLDLQRDDGERFAVQLTRDEAERLELERGQIVYVRPVREKRFQEVSDTLKVSDTS